MGMEVTSIFTLLLCSTGINELRIDLEDFENNKTFAKYGSFSISGESDKYKLTLGDMTAGDAGRWRTCEG